jgi:hypothetical protein
MHSIEYAWFGQQTFEPFVIAGRRIKRLYERLPLFGIQIEGAPVGEEHVGCRERAIEHVRGHALVLDISRCFYFCV